MARNKSFIPYDEHRGSAFDDDASDPEFPAYGSVPALAAEDYPFAEDPMPLFLSDNVLSGNADEPRPRGFGTGGERIQAGAIVWPRIFKAGLFSAAAAAVAFTIVSVGNPLALFADAKASLSNAAADQSGAVQKSDPPSAAAMQLANAGPPAQMVPATAGVQPVPAAVKVTRDDIALALRAAQQNLNAVQAEPPPAAAPPVRRLDADELAALLKRAKGLIAIGDIAPARLLLQRAADAQEAGAALLLAQTYDPAVLGTQDMRSITPDPALARDWYQKAARLGSQDAKQRLAQMQN
jgi:TPR repeat protein